MQFLTWITLGRDVKRPREEAVLPRLEKQGERDTDPVNMNVVPLFYT